MPVARSPFLLLFALAACARQSAPAASAPAPTAAARTSSDSLRPRPYPPFESPGFARAVARGTRTRTGQPGPRYWQQWAEYTLQAELDPAAKRLTGQGSVRYHNRSPDTLRRVAVQLHQNLFAPNAARVEEVPVTNGMELASVSAGGQTLREVDDTSSVGYVVDGTVMWIRLPRPLAPGAQADLAFRWAFTVPPDGAPRSGTDGEVFYIAYWYPQMAVYDDVGGWQVDPYMGNAEFYMGWGDYDVSLTLPGGWLVGSTGELRNPEQVLSERTRQRLAEARRTGRIVHVVTERDRGAGNATVDADRITWRFAARNVRDFAFGASEHYLWDATTAHLGDRDGDRRPDTTTVNTLYRPSRVQWAWDQSARYAQHSIEFLSRFLWPYGYPQITAVDGVTSCAGMEYPMITCIGGRRDTLSLYSVTVHELAHMWFPMQVGSDEKRHAWQDEGLTRFNQANAMREFFRGYDLLSIVRDVYLNLARSGGEVELMRHGDRYPVGAPAYGVASYQKMATNLSMLRALLGEETYMRAYREYGRRWLNRHPQPWDMWNTFEDVSGRDLGWFWRVWFYETWTLDQAVASVTARGDSTEIVVEDRGLAPMPARVDVTHADARVERLEVPVEVWLGGARRYVLRVPGSPTRVEIDPERAFADIDRSNNVWSR